MKSYGQVASFSDPKGITTVKISHDYLLSTTSIVAICFAVMVPEEEVRSRSFELSAGMNSNSFNQLSIANKQFKGQNKLKRS